MNNELKKEKKYRLEGDAMVEEVHVTSSTPEAERSKSKIPEGAADEIRTRVDSKAVLIFSLDDSGVSIQSSFNAANNGQGLSMEEMIQLIGALTTTKKDLIEMITTALHE